MEYSQKGSRYPGFGSDYERTLAGSINEDDYTFDGQESVFTPQMIFYKDIIEENIRKMIAAAGGADRLFPHMKTHKTAELLKLASDLGIKKVMAATIAEAELAAETGVPEIMLSYNLVGPNVGRYITLCLKYPQIAFYTLADDIVQLGRLSEAASAAGLTVNVLVDVNPGLNRTGILPESIFGFVESMDNLSGIRLCGIHFYEPNDRDIDPELFKENVMKQDEMIIGYYESVKASHPDVRFLVVGGTPELEYHAMVAHPDMFYSPGTNFLYDWTYAACFPSMDYRPAALIMSRVVSHPCDGVFTLDCGTKALSQDTRDSKGLLVGLTSCTELMQNEEHWVFKMLPGHEAERPEIGREVFIIPAHICPNMLFYPDVVAVSQGTICGKWKVAARDRFITV